MLWYFYGANELLLPTTKDEKPEPVQEVPVSIRNECVVTEYYM